MPALPLTPRLRAAATVAGVLLVGGLLATLGWRASERARAEADLEDRCDRVGPGDDLRAVFDRLGAAGYRPGCGHRVPCDRLDLGDLGAWDWLCDPADCSLLWRAGRAACLVELDPATRRVLAVDHDQYASP